MNSLSLSVVNTSPVLSGVKVDITEGRLRVVGSDLDLTIRTEVEVSAGESGSTVLPSRLVNEIMRSLDPGAVDIDIDHSVTGDYGRSDDVRRDCQRDCIFPQTVQVGGDFSFQSQTARVAGANLGPDFGGKRFGCHEIVSICNGSKKLWSVTEPRGGRKQAF